MRGFRPGQGGSRKAGARAIGKRSGGEIRASSSFKLAAPMITLPKYRPPPVVSEEVARRPKRPLPRISRSRKLLLLNKPCLRKASKEDLIRWELYKWHLANGTLYRFFEMYPEP